jgi:hypothetical protein
VQLPCSSDNKVQNGRQYSSSLQAYTFFVVTFGTLTHTLHAGNERGSADDETSCPEAG